MEDQTPEDYLKTLGSRLEDDKDDKDDKAIDLGYTALCLSALQKPGRSLSRYHHALQELVKDVSNAYDTLVSEGAEEGLWTKIAALKDILCLKEGFTGNREDYDNIENACLMSVMDNRKGLPVALATLYMHVCQKLDWSMEGLNFPAHFLVRISDGSDRAILDLFDDVKIMEAHDLRELLKVLLGKNAELSADYYEAVTNRDVLIRLQNNIKTRQIQVSDYASALETVQRMQMIAPNEFRLLFDAGILYAKVEQPVAAIRSFERYLEKAKDPRDRYDAEIILKELKETVN